MVRVHRGPPRRGRSWVRQTISLRAPGGHSHVTHSRNQADPRGHRRTRRRSNSSTGGTARTPQDPRGHGIAPVRDREAPGSNPGPPTKNRIQIEVFACSVWHAGVTGRSQIFFELGRGSPVQMDFEPSVELAHGYPPPIYQHAHGSRTVRHLGLKIKGAVHAGALPAHRSGP